MKNITVDADALETVLKALIGQPHYVRELQVTRSLLDNPINILVDEFNAASSKHNESTPSMNDLNELWNIIKQTNNTMPLSKHDNLIASAKRLVAYGST